MNYLTYDPSYRRLELRYEHSSSPSIEQRVERSFAPAVSGNTVGGAPWWANVSLEQVSCNAGQPMPAEFVAGFEPLFAKLEDISGDSEDGVTVEAANAAIQLLQYVLFAGYARPRMTWHGGDAVVFFWKVGKSATFLTVTSDDLSILHEQNGRFVRRIDGIGKHEWARIFA